MTKSNHPSISCYETQFSYQRDFSVRTDGWCNPVSLLGAAIPDHTVVTVLTGGPVKTVTQISRKRHTNAFASARCLCKSNSASDMPMTVPINRLKNLKLFFWFLSNALFAITCCLNDGQAHICRIRTAYYWIFPNSLVSNAGRGASRLSSRRSGRQSLWNSNKFRAR